MKGDVEKNLSKVEEEGRREYEPKAKKVRRNFSRKRKPHTKGGRTTRLGGQRVNSHGVEVL